YAPGGGEALRRAAFGLKKDIEQLAGVDQVLALGLDEPELHVDFDPERVAAAGRSPLQVADGVAGSFRHTPRGRRVGAAREWLVRLEGKTTDPQVLAQAAIVTPEGRVALDELGRVARGHERTTQTVAYNGMPAIMLSVTKQPGANTLELVGRLADFAAERN